MKNSSKNLLNNNEDFFNRPPTINQKAWGLINDFYHMLLTYMEKNKISQADLARKLGKSRSAISQMFSKTPNLTIKKMVEIADAIGLRLKITSLEIEQMEEIPQKEKTVFVLCLNTYDEMSYPKSRETSMFPSDSELITSLNVKNWGVC